MQAWTLQASNRQEKCRCYTDGCSTRVQQLRLCMHLLLGCWPPVCDT